MNELFRDCRHAVRVLRRRPGFTVTAALTIGLGVAATTALYSVVHATLIEPLPFADADRLAIVWGVAGAERDIRGASPPEVMDWRSMSTRLEDVSIYDQTNPTLSGAGGAARQLDAETVSAGYFALLGVTPVLGRAFTEAEEQPGSGRVVVIGNELWRNELGGSRSVLGSTLTIDERAHTIVGVLPQGFRGVAFDTEVWLPLVATVADADARRAFVERLLAEVRALPGVDAAAIAFSAPLRGFGSATILQREGNDDERIRYYRHAITPDYFAALRIPIVRGRAFAPADAATTDPVVIVGAETARRFWPDLDPIGRRLRLGTGESPPVATVVGVAGDVRMRGLTTSPTDPTDRRPRHLPAVPAARDLVL